MTPITTTLVTTHRVELTGGARYPMPPAKLGLIR